MGCNLVSNYSRLFPPFFSSFFKKLTFPSSPASHPPRRLRCRPHHHHRQSYGDPTPSSSISAAQWNPHPPNHPTAVSTTIPTGSDLAADRSTHLPPRLPRPSERERERGRSRVRKDSPSAAAAAAHAGGVREGQTDRETVKDIEGETDRETDKGAPQ